MVVRTRHHNSAAHRKEIAEELNSISGSAVTLGAATSWTPVLSDGTNDCTMNSGTIGRYWSLSDGTTTLYFITCMVQIDSVASASGAARITGLPEAAINLSSGFDFPLAVGDATSLATGVDKMVSAQVENASAYITLHVWDEGSGQGTTTMSIAEFSNNGRLKLSGFYIA